jgi:hypothetical protein
MPEIFRHIPEHETEPRREGVTLDDVKRFVAEHRHEPEFAATEKTPFWHSEDALFSFEAYCDRLRAEGSPELYRVRELTHFLDNETNSGGHYRFKKPHEITALLLPDIANRLKNVPYQDSRERIEAQAEHDKDMADLRVYEQSEGIAAHGVIEPILAIVENRIAWIDHEIEFESRQPNIGPLDEKKRRAKIKAFAESRRPFRRARVFLLGQYLEK